MSTNSLDLITVANDFVADSKHRLSIFGRFTESDCYSSEFCFKCKSSLEREAVKPANEQQTAFYYSSYSYVHACTVMHNICIFVM